MPLVVWSREAGLPHCGQGVEILLSGDPVDTQRWSARGVRKRVKVAEIIEGQGEVAHGVQGVGVVVAEHPPVAGQGLLEEFPGSQQLPSFRRVSVRC
jgi:hypothetical protein